MINENIIINQLLEKVNKSSFLRIKLQLKLNGFKNIEFTSKMFIIVVETINTSLQCRSINQIDFVNLV